MPFPSPWFTGLPVIFTTFPFFSVLFFNFILPSQKGAKVRMKVCHLVCFSDEMCKKLGNPFKETFRAKSGQILRNFETQGLKKFLIKKKVYSETIGLNMSQVWNYHGFCSRSDDPAFPLHLQGRNLVSLLLHFQTTFFHLQRIWAACAKSEMASRLERLVRPNILRLEPYRSARDECNTGGNCLVSKSHS